MFIKCSSTVSIKVIISHSFVFTVQGPVSLTIFDRNSNSMETSPCCNSAPGRQIATTFCTCRYSTAVVPCTKFCSGHCIRIKGRVKRNVHRIWIAREKPLVKRGPDYLHLFSSSSSTMLHVSELILPLSWLRSAKLATLYTCAWSPAITTNSS